MPQENSPVWLITGCSTGFGRELAKRVLERGFRVAVTARDPEKVQDIAAAGGNRAIALKLDVTDPVQVGEAVNAVEEKFGRLDVLVNNAGYGYVGAVEESREKEVREMFETNFFGLCRMIHVALPGMRRRRSGTIINVSSIGGLVAFPGVGYYNATKFAVEGLSEALAKEVAPLGIKVIIVEPGPFRTDWAGRSLQCSPNRIDEYNETAGAFRDRIVTYSGQQPGDPLRAADAIIEAVQSPHPPLRLLLGRMALETARAKLETLQTDFNAWEKTTLSSDFPS
jgi:NAD(P)-dependent dehydrogenase (short-subunit alcohol dehydrogenase family)